MHTAPQPGMRWRTGILLVSSVYLMLLFMLLRQPIVMLASPMPAAAVMLVMAPQISSSATKQQQAVGAQQSVAVKPAKPNSSKPEKMPSLASAQAPVIIAAAEKTHTAPTPAADLKPVPDKTPPSDTPPTAAAANSSAAPAPAAIQSALTAAPFNSDSPSNSAASLNWQSQVLSHLGKYRRYPGDARLRKQAGAAWIKLTITAEGKVLNKQLIASSGALILDREALQILERAQPLPLPPKLIPIVITLPVRFDIEN
ncbi:MAG: TonB family protein [Proteobacteria bacterium]|nr:TonB family protein [Pseudomonadota bacterium]